MSPHMSPHMPIHMSMHMSTHMSVRMSIHRSTMFVLDTLSSRMRPGTVVVIDDAMTETLSSGRSLTYVVVALYSCGRI